MEEVIHLERGGIAMCRFLPLQRLGLSLCAVALLTPLDLTFAQDTVITGFHVIPQQHRSSEAEVGRGPCAVHVQGGFWAGIGRSISLGIWDPVNRWVDVGRMFPAWVPVERDHSVVVLEGEVVPSGETYPGPHVAHEDLPISHYTHDFTFHVRPDPTPNNRYTNLLGLQRGTYENPAEAARIREDIAQSQSEIVTKERRIEDLARELQALQDLFDETPPQGKDEVKEMIDAWHLDHDEEFARVTEELNDLRLRQSDLRQRLNALPRRWDPQAVIEVEWESGFGASNDGNPLSRSNTRGNSGGFFSAGHRRREVIWNWPTMGDHVHVEGLWVWDRVTHLPKRRSIRPASWPLAEGCLVGFAEILSSQEQKSSPLGLISSRAVMGGRCGIIVQGFPRS